MNLSDREYWTPRETAGAACIAAARGQRNGAGPAHLPQRQTAKDRVMITSPRIENIDADHVADYLADWEIDAVVTEDRCNYLIESDDDVAVIQAMVVLPEYARRYAR